MKLRNKKTGEVEEFYEIYLTKTVKETNAATSEYVERSYYGIDELNEEWENYKPAEPLIKDEKIRKAVRAWAEACRLKYATYKQSSNEFYDPDTRGKFAIKFTLKPIEVLLDDGKCYTIDELCGEIACEPVKEMDGWRKNERPNGRRKTDSRESCTTYRKRLR